MANQEFRAAVAGVVRDRASDGSVQGRRRLHNMFKRLPEEDQRTEAAWLDARVTAAIFDLEPTIARAYRLIQVTITGEDS